LVSEGWTATSAGGQGEDQPVMPGIDERVLEYVAEELAGRRRRFLLYSTTCAARITRRGLSGSAGPAGVSAPALRRACQRVWLRSLVLGEVTAPDRPCESGIRRCRRARTARPRCCSRSATVSQSASRRGAFRYGPGCTRSASAWDVPPWSCTGPPAIRKLVTAEGEPRQSPLRVAPRRRPCHGPGWRRRRPCGRGCR